MALEQFVLKRWYGSAGLLRLLQPLSGVAAVVTRLKRRKHQKNIHAPLPVIVIGNITVGGTGKTPLVIAVVEHLMSLGLKPGVVSRGYGGQADYPYFLDDSSTSAKSGDEPLLIFQRCNVPVCVAPKRREAIEHLLEKSDCNIVVSDDGLQHFDMARSIEIAVIDGERGLGNGNLLPVGPLRESAKALADVDVVVSNGELKTPIDVDAFTMTLVPGELQAVGETDPERYSPSRGAVNAVAGIGNPSRFFETLRQLSYIPVEHAFSDHHSYTDSDLDFDDGLAIIMTEKDAVKCQKLALDRTWYLPVTAELPAAFYSRLNDLLRQTPLAIEINS